MTLPPKKTRNICFLTIQNKQRKESKTNQNKNNRNPEIQQDSTPKNPWHHRCVTSSRNRGQGLSPRDCPAAWSWFHRHVNDKRFPCEDMWCAGHFLLEFPYEMTWKMIWHNTTQQLNLSMVKQGETDIWLSMFCVPCHFSRELPTITTSLKPLVPTFKQTFQRSHHKSVFRSAPPKR